MICSFISVWTIPLALVVLALAVVLFLTAVVFDYFDVFHLRVINLLQVSIVLVFVSVPTLTISYLLRGLEWLLRMM